MIDYKVLYDPYRVQLDFISDDLRYPLHVLFTNHSGKIFWQTEIYHSHSWVQGPPCKGLNIRVLDTFGDLVFSNDWTFSELSDIVEKKFINWCRDFYVNENRKPNGVVIGSHDGSSGEWVEAYSQDLIGKCLLIEPNLKPFLSLTCKYSKDQRFTFKKCVISDSDDFVDFYTNLSGDSESSSLLSENMCEDKITVKSYNPNTILKSIIPDWIHIDAEGYDAKIILLINDKLLDSVKFIIWEHIYLDETTNKLLSDKLQLFGFNIIKGDDYNSCAYKI